VCWRGGPGWSGGGVVPLSSRRAGCGAGLRASTSVSLGECCRGLLWAAFVGSEAGESRRVEVFRARSSPARAGAGIVPAGARARRRARRLGLLPLEALGEATTCGPHVCGRSGTAGLQQVGSNDGRCPGGAADAAPAAASCALVVARLAALEGTPRPGRMIMMAIRRTPSRACCQPGRPGRK